ncbi:MAG: DUF554 domain-containing protein [Propionibacteriaceae bacterium]|nr:DUF554 domain-containing protein [Propionibacteriaceae bacterium]
MFAGSGTVINVVAVLAGSGIGMLLGNRFPERTRELIMQAMGLFTLVLGASAIASGLSAELSAAVGSNASFLIVLGALLIGGICGSLLRIEERLDAAAEWLRVRIAKKSESGRFVEGMVTATLIFCVGPMSILGAISDGLGQGNELLVTKSIMDGFSSIAFASGLGVGVMASVVPLFCYQGALTLVGMGLGEFLSTAQIDALGATGGVILLGMGVRLAGIKRIAVGDLLPALVVAPVLVWLVGMAV